MRLRLLVYEVIQRHILPESLNWFESLLSGGQIVAVIYSPVIINFVAPAVNIASASAVRLADVVRQGWVTVYSNP